MFEAVDSVFDGLLRGVATKVCRDDHSASMSFADDLTDGPHLPRIDFESRDLPRRHIGDELKDFGRIGDGNTDVFVDRRVSVDEPAGEEDTRAGVWMRLGKMCNNSLGDRFHYRCCGPT